MSTAMIFEGNDMNKNANCKKYTYSRVGMYAKAGESEYPFRNGKSVYRRQLFIFIYANICERDILHRYCGGHNAIVIFIAMHNGEWVNR